MSDFNLENVIPVLTFFWAAVFNRLSTATTSSMSLKLDWSENIPRNDRRSPANRSRYRCRCGDVWLVDVEFARNVMAADRRR